MYNLFEVFDHTADTTMNIPLALLILNSLPVQSSDAIDSRVKAALETRELPQLYREYARAAQRDPKDALNRYGAVVAYQKLYGLYEHKLVSFAVHKEKDSVLRMADEAIANAPKAAYPLLAKIYLLSTIPEQTFGPRPLSEATRKEWREQTIYDPRTGKTRKEKILVYVYEDRDPKMLKEMEALIAKALRLEPQNPKVLITASHVAQSGRSKLNYVRRASRADAKQKYPVGYLLAAYEAYEANELSEDAEIAREALEQILERDHEKVWVKLFRLQHKKFRKS